MEDIILLGIGGHAHSVVDSIEQTGKYNILGFLDTEAKQGKCFRNYYVLDTDDALPKYFAKGVKNAFVTIGFTGNSSIRKRLYNRLRDIGYTVPNVIDNTAVISNDVEFEDGIFVGKGAIINANTKVGKMCIINTGAIIEHDCVVSAFSHIAVGAVLCGSVIIGNETFIGANATIIQQTKVGNGVIAGAGVVVTKDIPDKAKVVGNPVRYID